MQPYRPGSHINTSSVVWSIAIMLAVFAFFAFLCGGPTPTQSASRIGASDPTGLLGGVVMIPVIVFAIWKCKNL